MLQSLAVWVLQTYLGEYIENLNTDQLTVGYGGIELENLHLKKSALEKLQLPVKLIRGFIGQLNLVIPYANPNTQPWVIKIHKLCLVLNPDSEIPREKTKEEKDAIKQIKLKKLEEEWKANMEQNQKSSWLYGSWLPSVYSSMSTTIAENLVLEINDVHVKYEYLKQPSVAFGIRIGSLSAKSENNKDVILSNQMKLKVVELKDLSLYFDRGSYAHNETEEGLKDVENILSPVSAVCLIQRNASKISLTTKDGPRFKMDFSFKEIALVLSKWQYQTFFDIMEEFTRYFKAKEHSAYRPAVTVKGNARRWWKFAIQAIMDPIVEKNFKQNKKFVLERVKDINAYVRLYSKYVTLAHEVLDAEKTIIKAIEEKMKYEEIAVLRKIVYTKVVEDNNAKKIAASKTSSQLQKQSWSQWAMSFYYTHEDGQKDGQSPSQEDMTMTKEEREFLENLKGTIDLEEESIFKKDSIFTQICFSLKSGSIQLNDEEELKILDVGFQNLVVTNEARPKSRSFEWTVSLGDMTVKNLYDKAHSFPSLLSPSQTDTENSVRDGTPFLKVNFGQSSLQGKLSSTLSVNLQPSSITYNPKVFGNIKDFFILPQKSKYNLLATRGMKEKIQETFHSRFQELKEATKNELANIVGSTVKQQRNTTQWTINLDLSAPQFIIPVAAKTDTEVDDRMLLVNFGRIAFCNQHAKKDRIESAGDADGEEDEFLTPSATPPDEMDFAKEVFDTNLPEEIIRERFYDSYTLELTMLQVLVCSSQDDWKGSQLKGFGPNHVIERFSVSLALKRRILFTADPEYPALTLMGVLPQLFVHIDEKKLQAINACIEVFSSVPDRSLNYEPDLEVPAAGVSEDDRLASVGVEEIMPTNFKDLLIESKLILAKFSFEKLSLALHSRGRCFAELQIDGVECEFSKRPYDLSVTFVVESLRLVDAIQTFGPDYELLVTSKIKATPSIPGETHADELLMHVCYQKISADCPSLGNTEKDPVQILSVNVGTLLVNGNLETIVELKNIVNQLMQKKQAKSPVTHSSLSESRYEENQAKETQANSRMEVDASFKQVDVLILRTDLKESLKIPVNVARLTAKNFEVIATIGDEKKITGSIGNILLQDVSFNSLTYKNILSFGSERKVTSPVKIDEEFNQAFKFTYKESSISDKNDTLKVHMASLYYFHNPRFVNEMSLCVGDYKLYAYNLAKSFQSAATDMAKSMVEAERTPSVKHTKTLSYSVLVDTPVVILPKDDTSQSLVVGYLGKISACNEEIYKPSFEEGCEKSINRIILEIDKINLSVIDFSDKELFSNDMAEILLFFQDKLSPIIHNTNLYLHVDTIKDLITNEKTLDIASRISTPLKVFLSVPVYQQILSTISFATRMQERKSSSPTSPVLTPTSSMSHLSFTSESTWENHQEMTDVEEISIDERQGKTLNATFQIPSVQIELHGELQGKSHGFVIVEFDTFDLKYNNYQNLSGILTISLQSFSIEDLLHDKQDKYRYLVSSSCDMTFSKLSKMYRRYTSCPEDIDNFAKHGLSKSLPSNLDTFGYSRSPIHDALETVQEVGPLVKITVDFAEEKQNDDNLENSRKNITVDINSIDFVINLQTWVILLEFFGIGSQNPATSPVNSKHEISQDFTQDVTLGEAEPSETELQISMKSVAFYLNKEEYPLAKASVNAMSLRVLLKSGNQDVQGCIGNINLFDLSPYSGFYPHRLASFGDKAFEFSFFRYGQPDPDLHRNVDMSLNLTMSSIQYVHTQRFLMEFISFCQHFLLLQEVLGRMRAASAGDEVTAVFNRAARLLLKVNSDSPILLLPHKSASRDLFVANLGKLAMCNEFLYSSNPKTNAYSFIANRSRNTGGQGAVRSEVQLEMNRLLDTIHITLTDMEVFSALKLDSEDSKNGRVEYKRQGHEMMEEPCTLELTLERNLEWMFGRQVPDMSISGILSSVYIYLDLSQYSLIMGMLGENLGEQLESFDAPSTVLIDPLVMASPARQVWTTMRIALSLSNVSIIISPTFSFGDFPNSSDAHHQLARFDFRNSTLIYESFSDSSKSIDLVSSDVLLNDIRNKDEVGILLPSSSSKAEENYLQFEVHYLDTVAKSFVTFLCNQSRIILLFDFLLEVSRFIMRTEENEFKAKTNPLSTSSSFIEDFEHVHSPGVVTKAKPQTKPPEEKKLLEVKVNITESELVMVEDISAPDTQTVILKVTSVLAYRPNHFSERPVTCSLQNLEVFSCLMNQPDSSALSIVDPVAFLLELNSSKKAAKTSSPGLQDAMKMKPVLEMQFQAPVSIRVSYHDVQMFMRILNKSKKQISSAMEGHQIQNQALELDMEESVNNSTISSHQGNGSKHAPLTSSSTNEGAQANAFGGFQIKASTVSLVLIDDCGNNDAPLIEFLMSNILLHHTFDREWKGSSECSIDAKYYNIRVSAWEPFIESWRFNIHWSNSIDKNHEEKVIFKIDAPERLDLNLTSAFIGIAKQTATVWSAKFMQDAASKDKKRAPFLPFLLRNKTGSKLSFYIVKRSPTRWQGKTRDLDDQIESLNTCRDVKNNGEVAFTFEKRTKTRHHVSHQLTVHQVIVQVGDWKSMDPLSVDRVGQFFRIAYPQNGGLEVFVLFDISLEGARKVITVTSALSIKNTLNLPIEIMAEQSNRQYPMTVLNSKETYHFPLKMVRSDLYIRPCKNNDHYFFCNKDITWKSVVSAGERGLLRSCASKTKPSDNFRFCAIVKYFNIPKALEEEPTSLSQPEHSITIMNHVLLQNCLPVDLFYMLRGSPHKELVRPGDQVPLMLEDPEGSIDVGFSMENYPDYDLIKVSQVGNDHILKARVYDYKKRLLLLNALVTFRSGTISISVYAQYWLLNKTGIPLIFKREEDNDEVSGQFQEHEEARSLTPLLFSYIYNDKPFNYCIMRIGQKYQPNKGMIPLWCKPFSLEKESDYRNLYVKQYQNKLERSYDIGITVSWGEGVFSQTKIVSFVPRFQIDNQTSYKLTLIQRYILQEYTSVPTSSITTCYPGTVCFFHWHRADYDQIVSINLPDDTGSLWSGGIQINRETSYHVNIKTNNKKRPEVFLRTSISFNAGTYRCTISDATTFPPPYRIVNLSEVSLFYWQEDTNHSQTNSFIKGKETKDYVLDEPLLPAKLVISVYNESTEVFNLHHIGRQLTKLYYQNAIFIAFTHTFSGSTCNRHTSQENTDHQLVLDVIDGKNVVLSRKQEHRRSQLWRMNAEGNLVHFASSSTKSVKKGSSLVLDVEERIIENRVKYYLVLNAKDFAREKTQTWFFESNMLQCILSNMVVHCPDQLKENSPVLLGPKPPVHENTSFFYSCVSRQNLRPGSGVLSVRIFGQGPSQVLEVSDSLQEASTDQWVLCEQSHSNLLTTSFTGSLTKQTTTEVVVSLAGGFGVSFINLRPEELLFFSLNQILFHSKFSKCFHSIDLEVGSIQIDNQLFGCEVPVTIYPSPQAKKISQGSSMGNNNLQISVRTERDSDFDFLVFKNVATDICRLNIELEDRLVLKLIQAIQEIVAGEPKDAKDTEEPVNVFDTHKIDLKPSIDVKDKLFFEDFIFNQGELKISLLTTGKIDEDLVPIKKSIGIPFISFQDAAISFDRYQRLNLLETKYGMLQNILQFYKETFTNQAASLLGSLDILGNPVGFIQDLSSGVEGLLKKGNIGGLFFNVAHGFSDSAAKVTGSIANGLWSASMDNKFQESRDSLRVSRASSSGSHFSAGLKGLGMGVIGGLTSMVTQPIEGASRKGVSGFLTGLGKGLVGTVAKPVAGVLDLASGTAAAVRMSTETTYPKPKPIRLKRNCYGPGGVLGKYSRTQAEGQEILMKFNEGSTEEMFVSMETVRPSSDRLKVILTNIGVYFVKSGPPCAENIKLHVEYSRMLDSSYYFEDGVHFIEMFLCRRQDYSVQEYNLDNRTAVRCESERIVYKIVQRINYLKSLYEESLFALHEKLC